MSLREGGQEDLNILRFAGGKMRRQSADEKLACILLRFRAAPYPYQNKRRTHKVLCSCFGAGKRT